MAKKLWELPDEELERRAARMAAKEKAAKEKRLGKMSSWRRAERQYRLGAVFLSVAMMGVGAAAGYGLIKISSAFGRAAAQRTLEKQQYKNIEMTGVSWTGCREISSNGFSATSPAREPVKGAVCQGPWQDPAVRVFSGK